MIHLYSGQEGRYLRAFVPVLRTYRIQFDNSPGPHPGAPGGYYLSALRA
jgi:hypothetical protein